MDSPISTSDPLRRDDLATPLVPADPGGAYQAPRRVVSLVPSITEALAVSCPEVLVGATDWCAHPVDLEVSRVRGTKNPDLAAIAALQPDLVIANREENRELDVRRLRDRGIPVWVTKIETVDEAFDSLGRLFAVALEQPRPAWLDDAESAWAQPLPLRGSVAVPIWRDPWMVVGEPTFTSDLLRRAGWRNVYGDADTDGGRYPSVSIADIESRHPELVLLPDEPYVFSNTDGPEAFRSPTRLVSGRLLTWYGPSLCEAARVLR